ncbi:GNAT family N-acetyltransferase [Nocardioides ferulae]|uniref:GNAT family N-acetyltransferase n=1 Tax=Nocardioides ferulae TaxID=2340821 RepID=UPI000EB5085F|nr:GNAT family N-acetyltransferase [Nocardioides ferulae]
MIDLRVLTPDDWRAWRELRLAALADAPDAFGSRLADWQGEGDREERWRDRLSIHGAHDVIASLDGTDAGMTTGVPTADDGTVELISMWVAPGARGRGVGDALIGEVERWGRSTSAAVLRLTVMDQNAAAAALYRRNGFEPTGEVEVDDDGRRELVLAKPLTG